MFKRLMIGLMAVGLVTIFIAESANARAIAFRRSVGITVTGGEDWDTFDTDIFGLPFDADVGCGLIRGDVYCLAEGADENACDMVTGYSTALVLGVDIDLIKPKTKPHRFSDDDLNGDIIDFGQRQQLRIMEELALSDDYFTIELPTGETDNKAGIHRISDSVVNYWRKAPPYDSDDEALTRFVGDKTSGLPDDGFGINGEEYLKALPGEGMVPISGENLEDLVGHIVCMVVHTDQINGDDLHGKYRGIFAGKVRSTTTSSVTMELLDSDDIRKLTLYNDVDTVPGLVENDDCIVYDKKVFAPELCSGVTYVDDAYPETHGEISCGDRVCKDTLELELKSATRDTLCGTGETFVKFIPKNLGQGEYADYAFIGVVKNSDSDPSLDELIICGDSVPSGEVGVEYMRYGCVPFEGVIPDCCHCIEWGQDEMYP